MSSSDNVAETNVDEPEVAGFGEPSVLISTPGGIK